MEQTDKIKVKVLGIHSSPKDGATAAALRYALARAEEIDGIETEFAELRKGGANPCMHCGRCIREKLYECPVYDDAIRPLYAKIREADAIIFASPVYDMAPNAQMAALFGRMYPLGKTTSRGEWGRKVGCAVAVGGSRNGGVETTLSVLNRYMLSMGMNLAGAGVYAYRGAAVWSKDHHDDSSIIGDEQNRMNLTAAARRMAVMAKIIKTGIAAMPDIQGYQIAGFTDEADRQAYLDAFWNQK